MKAISYCYDSFYDLIGMQQYIKSLFIGGDFLVTILETELKKGIEQAIKKAKKSLAPILVSEVQKVEHIEPLSFFLLEKTNFMVNVFFGRIRKNKRI